MAEDESQDQEQPEPDPAAPGREAEEAAGSGSASEDQESGDAAPAAATASDSDSEDAGREAEEAAGSGSASEDQESGDAAPAAATAGDSDSEAPKPKAKDAPPGAELDPIALEPERELSAEERARLEAEAEERARLEAEATAEGSDEEPVARSGAKVELPGDALIQATGKRKSSIARVVLRPGSGAFEVNSRELEEYFPRHQHQTVARQALAASGYEGTVDVRVRVHGGGISGQAGAVRHGIARALCEVDPELRGELKRRGLLTRDARAKERRKAGLKKARKRPQFSKR
jgi:small subunit ribosomal protein S9